jgi:ABC-type sugar transport system ATPase subunit
MKLLKAESLCYSRNGHRLLTNINFEIRARQVTGIIADNQERLDLLLSVIGGSLPEDSGAISIKGRVADAPTRLRRIGISQEPGTLVDKLTVLDNIFLGSSGRFSRFGLLNKSVMKRRGKEILKRIEALIPIDQALAEVEPGSRILIDIARVMAKEPDCYIFNGVTRGMGLRQYDSFLGLVRELKEAGHGVALVPINSEDIRSMIDRLYFLKNGQLFEIEDCKGLSDDDLNEFLLSPGKRYYKAANDPIQKAQEMIDAAACEQDIDFHQLAERVAMSYDNFRRRFKVKVGSSPHQYFLQKKIEKAKELLLYTDTEIKDVAVQVGFPDPYYFSRVFKEREGIAPGRFRGSQQSDLRVKTNNPQK